MTIKFADMKRATKAYNTALKGLNDAQYDSEPLFTAAVSFMVSLCNSAVKREGDILGAAIQDAIDAAPGMRNIDLIQKINRKPDVIFVSEAKKLVIALEIKRGSRHDSGNQRQFKQDMVNLPPLVRQALPAECITFAVEYRIVFLNGKPPIQEGLTPTDLYKLYGLNVSPYTSTARQHYSAGIDKILKVRLPDFSL